MMDDASDLELLNRTSDGEEAAFLVLYRRWQGHVYRYALRITGAASTAEDVTQDVFMALMSGASGFDPARGTFGAYIYGITRNHVLRRTRRERFFAALKDDMPDTRSDSGVPLHKSSDPLGDLARKETIESLHRAILALPMRYREVVVLCELHELDYAEAARVVRCPEGTIRSRLHRARALLIERLRGRVMDETEAARIGTARCLS